MEELYKMEPFSLKKEEKANILYPKYKELTEYHYNNCIPYHRILDCFSRGGNRIEDIPFIPVRLFKEFELLSVPRGEITRTVLSSGTTGQISSKIFLDKSTAKWQQKVLTRIVSDFIGKSRMPMLIADCPDVIKDRTMFSTRGSGILGFSTFGTKREFALNSDMSLNHKTLDNFLREADGKRFLIFGFTFIIWKHLLLELEKEREKYDFSNAVMVHGEDGRSCSPRQLPGKSLGKDSRRFAVLLIFMKIMGWPNRQEVSLLNVNMDTCMQAFFQMWLCEIL